MDRNGLQAAAISWADHFKIDRSLVMAIIEQESGWRDDAIRFEPAYSWLLAPETFADKNHISVNTERALQRFSVGPMQVMGAVCRELGYDGNLSLLAADPSATIGYGVKHLSRLNKRYPKEADTISAYNAGSPRQNITGAYSNQAYVDSVQAILKRIRVTP